MKKFYLILMIALISYASFGQERTAAKKAPSAIPVNSSYTAAYRSDATQSTPNILDNTVAVLKDRTNEDCFDNSLPLLQDFNNENSYYCWTTISNNTANGPNSGCTYPMGLYFFNSDPSNLIFGFSSFHYATDYNQYLISPQLSAAGAVSISFDYAASSQVGTETFRVGYSSTTNAVSAFTWSNVISTNSINFARYTGTAPAGTKYIAINYTSVDRFLLFVDNILIDGEAISQCDITLSYYENFDSYGTLDYTANPIMPDCWEKLSNQTNRPCLRSITSAPSQPNALYMYANGSGKYNLAIMPELESSISYNRLLLGFDYMALKTNDTIYVGTMSDINDIATYATYTFFSPAAANTWYHKVIDLSSYAGNNRYIVFRVNHVAAATYEGGYGYIDNVELYNLCDTIVGNLVSTNNGRDVIISWTAPVTAPDHYSIFVDETEYTSATSSITFSGLTNGVHTIKVAAIYGSCKPLYKKTHVSVLNCQYSDVENLSVSFNDNCSSATLTWAAQAGTGAATGEIFNNGSFITSQTGGYGNAAVSQMNTGYTTSLGYSLSGRHNADDMFLTGTSHIDSIKFFAYQTGSTTTSTFNGVFVRIYRGNPSTTDSELVWGDLITNLLSHTYFTGVYRVSSPLTDNTRPIMAIVANINIDLPAGDYWVDFTVTGTLSSGPWNVPVVHFGQPETGNSYSGTNTGTAFNLFYDTNFPDTYYEIPFVVYGNRQAGTPSYDIYRDGTFIAANVNSNTYTDNGVNFENAHTWDVKVACGSYVSVAENKQDICIPVGINETDKNGITIYPNPASNSFNVRGEKIDKIEIYDIYGKLISSTDKNFNNINVSTIATGTYIIKVYSLNNSLSVHKLIIEK